MNLLNGPQNGLPKCLFLPPFKEWCAQKHRRKLLENSHTCRVDENYPWASSGKSLVLCSTIGNYWMRSLLMFFSVSYLNDKKLYAVWVTRVKCIYACLRKCTGVCTRQMGSLYDFCVEILFLKREKNSLLKIKYRSMKDTRHMICWYLCNYLKTFANFGNAGADCRSRIHNFHWLQENGF